jgi:plasmid stability protein
MAVVTVRNLPEETHRALKVRAAQNGRSTEAEIREILTDAVRPRARIRIGTELAAFGRRHGGLDLEISRDSRPAEPATYRLEHRCYRARAECRERTGFLQTSVARSSSAGVTRMPSRDR